MKTKYENSRYQQHCPGNHLNVFQSASKFSSIGNSDFPQNKREISLSLLLLILTRLYISSHNEITQKEGALILQQ